MYIVYNDTGTITEIHSNQININSDRWIFYSGDITGMQVDVLTGELIPVPETPLDYFKLLGLWQDIRVVRNQKLTETDWVITQQLEQLGAVTEPWRVYRQALRDITTQTDPLNIVWPTRP